MLRMVKSFCCLLFIVSIIAVACQKQPETSNCKHTYLGYRGVYGKSGSTQSCVFGTVEKNTAFVTPICNFENRVSTNHGAYSTKEFCYYVFRNDGAFYTPLYKLALDGAVTTYKGSVAFGRYDGLLYNRFDDKLYVFERISGGIKVSLSELLISGSEYTVNKLVTDLGIITSASIVSSTVNNKTGEIFFQIGTDTSSSLYSYLPSHAKLEKLYSSNSHRLFGLAYDVKGDLLYGLRQDKKQTHLTVFSQSGTIVAADTIPLMPDLSFCSAVFDDCSGEYILAGKVSDSVGYYIRFNKEAKIITQDTINGIMQGLTILN